MTTAAGTISAASAEITTLEITPCTTLCVRVEADSAAPLEVNIPSLHGSDWVLLRAGEVEYFRLGFLELDALRHRGSGGTATGRYAVVGKTTWQHQ